MWIWIMESKGHIWPGGNGIMEINGHLWPGGSGKMDRIMEYNGQWMPTELKKILKLFLLFKNVELVTFLEVSEKKSR